MSFAFDSGRPSKDVAKVVRRGAPPPVRHGAINTPQREFDTTFDELARDLVTDPRIQGRLKGYRDTIPFVAKRDSQQYLAAAIIAWHLLVEVGSRSGNVIESIEQIDPKRYREVADPVLAKLMDSLGSRRREVGVARTSSARRGAAAEGDENKPELTLFRHVSMVTANLRRG
jgi:hypothetical protein